MPRACEDDVRQAAAVAAKWKLPLTVRAGGTGNYGQCVPLEGGLVFSTSPPMSRVLEIGDGRVRVQAGARMHDIELAVAETGQALRMWPSTWHVASIGGFIAGGFGGIGSIRHGILRDPGNLLRARIMTVERELRMIELHGDEIQQVHHAYGTNGILTEFEVALSPAVEWVHCIALFDSYRRVLDFGVAASTPGAGAVPAVGGRCPLLALLREPGRPLPARSPCDSLRWSYCRTRCRPSAALVAAHGGHVSLDGTEAELQAAGLPPAYECAYNHTTLQALKVDRSWTSTCEGRPTRSPSTRRWSTATHRDLRRRRSAAPRVRAAPAASTAPSRSCWCAGRARPTSTR